MELVNFALNSFKDVQQRYLNGLKDVDEDTLDYCIVTLEECKNILEKSDYFSTNLKMLIEKLIKNFENSKKKIKETYNKHKKDRSKEKRKIAYNIIVDASNVINKIHTDCRTIKKYTMTAHKITNSQQGIEHSSNINNMNKSDNNNIDNNSNILSHIESEYLKISNDNGIDPNDKSNLESYRDLYTNKEKFKNTKKVLDNLEKDIGETLTECRRYADIFNDNTTTNTTPEYSLEDANIIRNTLGNNLIEVAKSIGMLSPKCLPVEYKSNSSIPFCKIILNLNKLVHNKISKKTAVEGVRSALGSIELNIELFKDLLTYSKDLPKKLQDPWYSHNKPTFDLSKAIICIDKNFIEEYNKTSEYFNTTLYGFAMRRVGEYFYTPKDCLPENCGYGYIIDSEGNYRCGPTSTYMIGITATPNVYSYITRNKFYDPKIDSLDMTTGPVNGRCKPCFMISDKNNNTNLVMDITMRVFVPKQIAEEIETDLKNNFHDTQPNHLSWDLRDLVNFFKDLINVHDEDEIVSFKKIKEDFNNNKVYCNTLSRSVWRNNGSDECFRVPFAAMNTMFLPDKVRVIYNALRRNLIHYIELDSLSIIEQAALKDKTVLNKFIPEIRTRIYDCIYNGLFDTEYDHNYQYDISFRYIPDDNYYVNPWITTVILYKFTESSGDSDNSSDSFEDIESYSFRIPEYIKGGKEVMFKLDDGDNSKVFISSSENLVNTLIKGFSQRYFDFSFPLPLNCFTKKAVMELNNCLQYILEKYTRKHDEVVFIMLYILANSIGNYEELSKYIKEFTSKLIIKDFDDTTEAFVENKQRVIP